MFFESNICWVSSATERLRYDDEPRAVRGAKPTMKKWRRGKGIMLTASLRRSALSYKDRTTINFFLLKKKKKRL